MTGVEKARQLAEAVKIARTNVASAVFPSEKADRLLELEEAEEAYMVQVSRNRKALKAVK